MVGFGKQSDGRLIQHARRKAATVANSTKTKPECSWRWIRDIRRWEDDHGGAGVVSQPYDASVMDST
jgi:hypothetical protein